MVTFPPSKQTNKQINSMEQSPSWEANSRLAGQEIFLVSFNPKVHYRVHKSLPLVCLDQLNPSHGLTSYFFLRSILILSYHLRLGASSDPLPSDFTTGVLCALFISTVRATHPAHLTPLDLSPW